VASWGGLWSARLTRFEKAPCASYIGPMLWRTPSKVRPAAGFIEPCIPTLAAKPPAGPRWVYEIKHDGYRLMVRKSGDRVRIYTRRGADWTSRYPLIADAARALRARSAVLDGEGVICGPGRCRQFRQAPRQGVRPRGRAVRLRPTGA
jgi:ATP-dependent DNA ligase